MTLASKQKNAQVWERDEHDWYIEPESSTAALLRVERFVGRIHDPCCGQGNIVRTLIADGYEATGSDIVDRAGSPEWFLGTSDFINNSIPRLPNVVMNPPFFKAKGAEAFIRKAVAITEGKVAAFVDIKFLAGGKRANGLYRELPPHRVWIITPRPSCPPGRVLQAGGKAEGGTADWVWAIWSNTEPYSGTQLHWLRADGADK